MSQRPADYDPPDGYHLHVCPECRCVWEHEDRDWFRCVPEAEDVKNHTCPACGFHDRDGDSTYEKYRGGRRPHYVARPKPIEILTRKEGVMIKKGDRVKVKPDPVYSNRPHVGDCGTVELVREIERFYPVVVLLDKGGRCCFTDAELEPEPAAAVVGPDERAVETWEDDGGKAVDRE